MNLGHLLAFAWGISIVLWLMTIVMNTIQNPK